MPYGTINADLMTTSDGVSSSGLYGFKNRIINGAMVIDQRNAGASTTPADSTYVVDRFVYYSTQASKFNAQQVSTAPTGFINSLKFTTASAVTVGASDYFIFSQAIEGLNITDLGWGTANAKTVTLSFQVYSSLTGTFGGSLTNSGQSRSYPFTYTISSANTWTTVSITVAGDTSGTWLTTNGQGIRLFWGLGVGSTNSGTAGAWSATQYFSATGAVSVVGTNGATFYITGVQLEKGSTATSFDYRPYGTELQLCQRYFQVVNTSSGSANGTGSSILTVPFQVTMRAAPTMGQNGVYSLSDYYSYDSVQSSISISSPGTSTTGACIQLQNFSGLTIGRAYFGPRYISGNGNGFTASAEL